MKDAHFYIYNVGHGVCTLLMGKRVNGTPYCAVFDCGTKSQNYFCGIGKVIEDMKIKIQTHAKQIDLVVISHQDKDHWNNILDLFFSLNEIGQYDIFGKKGKIAWKLFGHNNLCSIIKKRSRDYYKKRYQAEGYLYSGSAICESGTMILYDFNVFIKLRTGSHANSTYRISLCQKKQYVLSIGDDYEETIESEFVDIDEVVRNCIIPYFEENDDLPDELLQALYDIGFSFSTDGLSEIYSYLDSEHFVDVKIPIRKVVMGGMKATAGYSRLIELMRDIPQLYDNYDENDSRWEPWGVYVYTRGYDVLLQREKFPPLLFYPQLDKATIRNTTSAVVVLELDNGDVLLLPGDATVHRFRGMFEWIESIKKGMLKLYLAPHHGSDRSNFFEDRNWQPLLIHFDMISRLHNKCNLVISAYNTHDLHPGFRFVDEAMYYFANDAKVLHTYAYAKDTSGTLATLGKFKNRLRIFTTNCLPIYDEGYFDYSNGEVAIGDMPEPDLICKSKRNPMRRLPPRDSFI